MKKFLDGEYIEMTEEEIAELNSENQAEDILSFLEAEIEALKAEIERLKEEE